MFDIILHPTASTPVPVTHVYTKRPRKQVDRSKRVTPTVADLRLMVKARGIKVTTAHTKGELLAMFATGEYVRPAAYARQALARKAKASA